MISVINSIGTWTPLDPPERAAQLRERDPSIPPYRTFVGNNLSSLDLYVYLKARFGPPNGIQMIYRSPSTDNLVHWHYTIRAGEAVIEVWQANLVTEVLIEGVAKPNSNDWKLLFYAVKADFKNHGSAMSEVRKDLEQWHLFINPYKRLRDVLGKSRDDLIALQIDSVNIPATPVTPEELKEFISAVKNEQQRFDEALRLGVLIRMLAPVLAEAFVNVILFLLAKQEIKNDERLYQDAIRREVDVRVRSLHIQCNGFIKPIDASSNRFKKFHTLMNGRNDFLHGNVDPKKLHYDTIHFDYKNVPIFGHRASFGEFALTNKLIHVEPEVALSDLDTVLQFIELVMESLDERARADIEIFMQSTSPGYRPVNGAVGVLFPEHVVHAVFGDNPPD